MRSSAGRDGHLSITRFLWLLSNFKFKGENLAQLGLCILPLPGGGWGGLRDSPSKTGGTEEEEDPQSIVKVLLLARGNQQMRPLPRSLVF